MVSYFVAPSRPSFLRNVIEGAGISCEVMYPSGKIERFGLDEPQFKIRFRDYRLLRLNFDEFAFADAYVNGEIDVEGDMAALMRLRTCLKDKVRFSAWLKFIRTLLFKRETKVNREAIKDHYQYGDDLYLSFIDKRYRFYSQGIFHSEDETLEEASEHKLESMYKALKLKPGMRLLDIGGGWVGVAQYCGSRGVRVTELTLGEDSYRYIGNLIKEQNLPCEVLLQDFLTYKPAEPFDAIVIYGVIEHIINYKRFAEQVWNCLRPDGLLFLDASASIVKYDVSGFSRKYIWSGTHTFLCLQDLLEDLLFHGIELVRVENESAHYGRTMLHWAKRLEENRSMIIGRWGEKLYRAFHLYLWGGSEAFPELLQAYHLVARRMDRRLPAPGKWRRLLGWVGR
jgi:cyclopropane-fatty-acyl-phospholipid synthase